jgi:hypothetical protein
MTTPRPIKPAQIHKESLSRIGRKNGTDVRTFVSVLVSNQLRVKSGKLKVKGDRESDG